jgi:hypothetical protein
MKRALLVGAVLLATTTAASAGTYLGLGIGPDANVGGTESISSGGRSARLLGGYSFGGLKVGAISVEASITGQSLTYNSNARGMFDAKELALAGRYNYPIGYHFEVFGKVGVHHTWLSHQDSAHYGSVYDSSGNGVLLGLGVEYRLPNIGPVHGPSFFLDYTHYMTTLEGNGFMFEGASVGMWMLGFTVGL